MTAAYKSVAPVTVEYAETGGPLTFAPTWHTITKYVEDTSITRGKSHWLSSIPAGSCTIRVLSSGREFDPNYASKLTGFQLGRRLRISTVISGVTYYLFSGHIEDIAQAPSRGRDDRVTITAIDLFGALNQFTLSESALSVTTESLSPQAWWRLDNLGIMPDASGNGRAASAQGDLVDGIAIGSSKAVNNGTITAQGLGLPGGKLQVSFLVKAQKLPAQVITVNDPIAGNFTYVLDPGPAFTATIGGMTIQSASTFPSQAEQVTFGSATALFPSSPFDGTVHHVCVVRNADNLTCYVDGIAGTTATGAGAGTVTVDVMNFRVNGVIDELSIHTTNALTAQNITDLGNAGRTAWAGERTDSRISRLLLLFGVDSGNIALDVGCVSLGAFVGGTDLASYIQQVAAAEDGRCFVAGTGNVILKNKLAELTGTTAYTIDDATNINLDNISAHQSRRDLVNYVSVTGPNVNGFSQDATSVTNNGRRKVSVTTTLTDPNLVSSLALKLVSQSATAAFGGEIIQLKVGVGTLHAWAGVIDVGTIITRTFKPAQVGTSWSGTFVAVGISHRINSDEWTATYTTIPQYLTSQAPYSGKTPFLWGTSLWDGAGVCWAA